MRQQGNIRQVDHEDLDKSIRKCYYATKRSLTIWGTIGIGKSVQVCETARDIAKEENLEFAYNEIDPEKFSFMDVRLSQMNASDVKGIPFPNKHKDATSTKWLLPDWLPRDKKSKGILFLDERNLVPPSIQAPIMSLINTRRIGNYKLPDGWLVISAGNRVQDKAHVFEGSKALENRFKHVELLIPTSEQWSKWAIKNDIDKRVVAFILWKPDNLMTFRPDETQRADLNEKAFATPRTWEFVSDDIKGESNIDDIGLYSSQSVGCGVADEFIAFLELKQKIPFKDIMRNPEKLNELIPPDRHDLLFTFVNVVSDWYRSNYQEKHLKRILEIAEIMRKEFAILMLRFCKSEHKQSFTNTVKKIPAWKNGLSQKYSDYL